MTRGRKNPDKPALSNLLPPCKVCGESATGFHYGVTTCTACKGFFRRSLVRKGPYICLQNQLCHVGPSTKRRDTCPKCRYQKCIGVGMSVTGIKVGRYSRANKSKYMAEYMNQQFSRSPSSHQDDEAFHDDAMEEESMMDVVQQYEAKGQPEGKRRSPKQDREVIIRDDTVTSSSRDSVSPASQNYPYGSSCCGISSPYDSDDVEISNSILTSFIGTGNNRQFEDLCSLENINRPMSSSYGFDYDDDEDDNRSSCVGGQSHYTTNPDSVSQNHAGLSPNPFYERRVYNRPWRPRGAISPDEAKPVIRKSHFVPSPDSVSQNRGGLSRTQIYERHVYNSPWRPRGAMLPDEVKPSIHESHFIPSPDTVSQNHAGLSPTGIHERHVYNKPWRPQGSMSPDEAKPSIHESHFIPSPDAVSQNHAGLSPTGIHERHVYNSPWRPQGSMSPDEVKPVILDSFQCRENVPSTPQRERVSISYSQFYHQGTTRLDNTPPPHDNTPTNFEHVDHARPSQQPSPDSQTPCDYSARNSISQHVNRHSAMNDYNHVRDHHHHHRRHEYNNKSGSLAPFHHDQSVCEGILDLSMKPPTPPMTEDYGPTVYSCEYDNNNNNKHRIQYNNCVQRISSASAITETTDLKPKGYSNNNSSRGRGSKKDINMIVSNWLKLKKRKIISGEGESDTSLTSSPKRQCFDRSREIAALSTTTSVAEQKQKMLSITILKQQCHDRSRAIAALSTTTSVKEQKQKQKIQQSIKGENSDLIIALSAGLDSDLKSNFLLYKTPDITYYAMSFFDQFPFKCFESNCLAPLMKDFNEIDDSVRELLLSPYGIRNNKYRAAQVYSDKKGPKITELDKEDNTYCLDTASLEWECERYCSLPELKYDVFEMDELFMAVLTKHDLCFGHKSTYMTKSDLQTANETFWGLCQLHDKVHGKINFIDDAKYFQILDETGIDVDRRQQYVLTYLELMDTLFVKDVKFFRCVPGYKDLKMKDKMTLLRSCSILYSITIAFRGMDSERNVCINEEHGWANRMGTFCLMFPQMAGVNKKVRALMREMVAMDLSHEEMVIFKVLILTAPYPYNGLEEPELITEIYKMYHKCLLWLVRKHHEPSQAEKRFGKIIGVLERLNSLRVLTWDIQMETTPKLTRLIRGHELPLFKELFCHYGTLC